MNSRERVLTALGHECPDRVPVTNRYTPEIAAQLAQIAGVSSGDSFDLEVALGHDMLCSREMGIVNTYDIWCNTQSGDEYVDDFGIVKKVVHYDGGSYLEMVKHPLEDLDAWASYTFPDPDQQIHVQKQYRSFGEGVRKYGKTHAIVGGVTCTILEGAEMLRGMSRLLMDLIDNEDFVNELFDKLMDYHFAVGKKLIQLGADILYIGDDAGTQQSMLLSPDIWRKFLKPRYDYLFREWRRIRNDIVFAFHTDGYVEPIIPDLVEIGLDILNPIQPECMDDEKLKREYGNRLSFWGGINVQKTIPFGTPAEVVAEVREKMRIYGDDGGFIISCAHNVQPHPRSIDNALIYYWAARNYGEYSNGKLAGAAI